MTPAVVSACCRLCMSCFHWHTSVSLLRMMPKPLAKHVSGVSSLRAGCRRNIGYPETSVGAVQLMCLSSFCSCRQLLTHASLPVCCSLSSWLWRHHWAGQPWDGLCQLHGAPAADAAAADVQPRDAFSDHGESLGAEHDV